LLIHAVNSERNARKILDIKSESSAAPEVTFIVPAFDQESIIWRHLESIIQNSTLLFELIVINDNSNDDTDNQICQFFHEKFIVGEVPRNFVAATYYRNLWPWFETRCDDFCIRKAKSELIIEIQADMLIRHKGFDKVLKSALESDHSLCAISARGTHSFSEIFGHLELKNGTDVSDSILASKLLRKFLYKIRSIVTHTKQKNASNAFHNQPNQLPPVLGSTELQQIDKVFPTWDEFQHSGRAGWLGDLIELLPYTGESAATKATESELSKIWRGDTVMRGPLAIRKETYLLLGGFDTSAFYQGNDDHDLFFRAKESDFTVGFSPVKFSSPTFLGNARKKRKMKSKIWSKFHKRIRKKNFAKILISRKSVSTESLR